MLSTPDYSVKPRLLTEENSLIPRPSKQISYSQEAQYKSKTQYTPTDPDLLNVFHGVTLLPVQRGREIPV